MSKFWEYNKYNLIAIVSVFAIVICLAVAASWIARAVPIDRVEHTRYTHEIIEHKRQVVDVYTRTVPGRTYESLKNPKDACHGAAVVVVNVMRQTTDKNESNTWVAVRPAGDDYKVICRVGGAYDDMWKENDTIRIYNGVVDGEE